MGPTGARALFLELEEARPRHEFAPAQAGEERDEPVVQLEAGIDRELFELAGEVDELAAAAVGPRGEGRGSRPAPAAAGSRR